MYVVTGIGGHDPYDVAYKWPLTLTLDRFTEIQLRQAQILVAHGNPG